jgi:hypothetical protein
MDNILHEGVSFNGRGLARPAAVANILFIELRKGGKFWRSGRTVPHGVGAIRYAAVNWLGNHAMLGYH